MRKLIVLTFVSLDGVMQAPGGPEEDVDGAFERGGWSVAYWDDTLARTMGTQMGHPFELLLGRRTFDTFAAAWPSMDPSSPINSTRKYVVTHRDVPAETEVWKNVVPLRSDIVAAVRRLKQEDGPELQVHGSSQLIHLLLQNDLVDELWLKTYPVILGRGKRLFGEGLPAGGWELITSETSASGVVVASYRRAGAIRMRSMADLQAEGQ